MVPKIKDQTTETDDLTLEDDQPEPQPEPEEGAEEGGAEGAQATQEEFSVSIGEEPEPEEPHGPAPKWVKEMRKQNKEQARRLRQLESELAKSRTQPPTPEIELGEKPVLEKFDYDTAKYEEALAEWYKRKLAADERAARAKAQAEEQQRKWNERLGAYERGKVVLGAEDFDDAEAVVKQHLDVVQQGILVHGAKDPALLAYALGKNPSKAQALGMIKDPVEFAFAAARLEAQLKVSGKKPVTQPETRIVGNGRPVGGSDATLERLRAEAERTNDFTKVAAYKRRLKEKQQRR